MEVGAFFPMRAELGPIAGAQATPAESLDEAAQGFEAMLARSLASTLLEPAMEGGLLGKGPGQSVFRSLLEDSVAEQWARSGSLGVADSVRESLRSQWAVSEKEDEA